MAKQVIRSEISSSDLSDENSTSSSETETPQRRTTDGLKKKDSIRHYVTNVLHRHGGDDEQSDRLSQTDIRIDTRTTSRHPYENISAFRQYHSNAEGTVRTDAQQRFNQSSTSDEDDLRHGSSTEQVNSFGKSKFIDSFRMFLLVRICGTNSSRIKFRSKSNY